ncbi:hypothetical protein CRX72_26490 [Pantoea sp. BRM17]|nr:hypothetical protein CRX72_26490 [Pantoea sp. BRM17]
MPFGQIGGVRGDLVGNKPLLDILFIGQPEVLFRRYIAEHGAAKPANHRRANTGGEVVIARCVKLPHFLGNFH